MNPWDATELEFRRRARSPASPGLFPLPNLVLYPHVMQPLHIFEERYREMLEDALAGDKLIAMAAARAGLGNRLRQPPARRRSTPAWAKSSPITGWRWPLQPAADGRAARAHRARARPAALVPPGPGRARRRLLRLRLDRRSRTTCRTSCSTRSASICRAPASCRSSSKSMLSRALAARLADRSGRLRVAARHRREAAASGRVPRRRAGRDSAGAGRAAIRRQDNCRQSRTRIPAATSATIDAHSPAISADAA